MRTGQVDQHTVDAARAEADSSWLPEQRLGACASAVTARSAAQRAATDRAALAIAAMAVLADDASDEA
ncbi:hypothetical protein [Demequina iriomotensis]|uniref:hypothetical protein n=1 Tax=Demequina iriomotensis TaxID=1536641 RepID=UPI0007867A2C|nr:hypothetical protein [Demequina iriomotensis]